MNDLKIYRGELFYFTSSPLTCDNSYLYEADGALVVSDGVIVASGAYRELLLQYSTASVIDYSGKLMMPGMIDTHLHFPQSGIIGLYGKQLMEWLNEYTFPAEMAYGSIEFSSRMAELFLRELYRNGTTACVAYGTVHPQSVEALFRAASRKEMRMLAGKVLMDRNAPEGLTDTVASGEQQSLALIEAWHGKGRNRYVLTPRFAVTSSFEQLKSAGALHRAFPDTYIQTHLSENRAEIETVRELFPRCKDYLNVYEQADMLSDRLILGHAIHLSDSESRRIAAADAIIAHCPTSNLFLGSGLFDLNKANEFGIRTTIATDVGGGTTFSLFKTMGEAYKVQQVNQYPMTVWEAFYKCTLGAAEVLRLEEEIGSLSAGRLADFIVVDYAANSSQLLRREHLEGTGKWTLDTKLFGLQILGDDRNIVATYIKGKKVYDRETDEFTDDSAT